MRKRICAFVVALGLSIGNSRAAKADMFGGDVVILTQILANAVQQLIQLRQILSAGEDSLDLLNEVNSGINNALGVAQTIGQIRDAGVFQDLGSAQAIDNALKSIYGHVPVSSESKVQELSDKTVAEAINLNNSLYTYANELDRVGERIKAASGSASPKGAQKLTAESLGILVTVMNQSLRAQASSLKLQAQAMASQNHKDKEFSQQVRTSAVNLRAAMGSTKPTFSLPRL